MILAWLTHNRHPLTHNGKGLSAHITDPYNPLDLPEFTLRCRFSSGYTPDWGDNIELVDAVENIWDITYNNESHPDSWHGLFNKKNCNEYLLEVLGANATGVSRTSYMFNRCWYLERVALFDLSTVQHVYAMFEGCESIQSIPAFDLTGKVSMQDMFDGCSSLTEINIVNTSTITDMYDAFRGCSSLQELPYMDTSNVTDMHGMCASCTSLTEVPLLDTSKVTDMSSIFFYCSSLTEIPLFDTSNVENMHWSFADSGLIYIPLLDTSKVTDMSGAFMHNMSLRQVPLLNTSSVVDISSAFLGDRNVESGALALYNQASSQQNPPSNYSACFGNCGDYTQTGREELAQIPTSWGGTMQ